jgi:hypothetical protein
MTSIKNLMDRFLKEKNNTQQTDNTNKILFEIDENHKINIKLDLGNFTDDSAEQLGLVLFLLNEGYYVQTFMDLITDLSHDNNTKFSQKVISSWADKINTSNSYDNKMEDEPLIKPTYFNNTK